MNKNLHSKNRLGLIIVLLVVMMITIKTNVSAQPLNESFEGTTFPPTGWTIQNTVGLSYNWMSQTAGQILNNWYDLSGANEIAPAAPTIGGNKYAIADFNVSSYILNDQWLITPAITVSSGDSLTFFLMIYSNGYADSLDVRLSTTTNSPTAFTTVLMAIDEGAITQQTWAQYGFSLSSYVGQTIYIAFREHVNQWGFVGSMFALDLVSTGQAVPSTYLPNSLTATPSGICPGGAPSTLGMNGGNVLPGDSWMWYQGSCGGTYIASGSTITVNPTVATTYFLRAEGSTNTTNCVSITLSIFSNASIAPTGASAIPVCSGIATTLNALGGNLGDNANWFWYDGSCGGNLIRSGANVVLSPTVSTTYFVRAEGACNTTTCASITAQIYGTSTAATSATASPSIVCTGYTSVLGITGGVLGDGSNWNWYTGSCGGTYLISGATTTQSVASTTTYYVRAAGTCNTTTCVSVTVSITTSSSTAPTSASASPDTLFTAIPTTLTVYGGSLDASGSWMWYDGFCGGNYITSGLTISQSPTVTTTYFVRGEDACSNTACVSVTVVVSTTSIKSLSILTNDLVLTPNPAKDVAIIKYSNAKDGLVKIELYNILGSKVSVILNSIQSKGSHKSNFDLSAIPSGIYSVKMTVDNKTIVRKLIITK